jgi:hypothetical protein
MDLAPLFCVSRVREWSLLLHIRGLLLVIPMISVISAIPTIFPISCVDLTIVLLLLRGPLAPWFKEPCLGLKGLNAYVVSDCKQIGHHSGLIHGDLLNSLDITNLIVEGINDIDVLDVQDSVPGIP